MNITLTGNLGSGKTSVCNELKKMGYNIISTGSIFREIATERGVSVIELNKQAETDKSIDDLIDSRTTLLGKKLDNTVFDSRLAWHFIPDSFKVFLLVDTAEAAHRVFLGENRNAEAYETEEDALNGLVKRASLERERFSDLYGVDYYDASNYNLIIESTDATPKEIAKEIIRNFELYKEKAFSTKIEVNISSLYPSQNIRDFSGDVLNMYRNKELRNQSLCARECVPVVEKDNYLFLLDGTHRTFAAANTGKKFVSVDFSNNAASKNAVSSSYLQEKDLYDFEDLGGFAYKKYPGKDKKSPYSMNFHNIGGPSFEKYVEDVDLNEDAPEL